MMDDNKSKNYNSTLISLTSELLYENDNNELSREDCYKYIVNDLKITLDKDQYFKILEKSSYFEFTPAPNDVELKLTSEKFREIDDKVQSHSIEYYINNFVKDNGLNSYLVQGISNLLSYSIYENINSFSTKNISSILPLDANTKFDVQEIDAFNKFLDDPDKNKNTTLFNVFLKAIEFSILTSGRGVKEFTQNIFFGKEYILDANIIFRLIGIGGEERRDSLVSLIQICLHQGIKFTYTKETYLEVRRKITASLLEITKSVQNKTIDILENLMESNSLEFQSGFIIYFGELRKNKVLKTPDQYEAKLLGDFRKVCDNHNISMVDTLNILKKTHIEFWANELLAKKKEISKYIRYTITAAKVDAINILYVKKLRGSNNHNYSDIKSFYLTTDRTLNRVLVESNQNEVIETILPSQLFILHSSLSEHNPDEDYSAFTKFLKRRSTEFKYTGREVLKYIDEIRSFTTETEIIKDVILLYSDRKFKHSLEEPDTEPINRSFKEFAETYIDEQLRIAQGGALKQQSTYNKAISQFPRMLNSSKKIVKLVDIGLIILIIPLSFLFLKMFTKNVFLLVGGTLFLEIVKFLISSKTNFNKWMLEKIYFNKINNSNYLKAVDFDDNYISASKLYFEENR